MHPHPLHLTPSLFIGIDVSKFSHVAGMVSSDLLAQRRFEQCPTVPFDHTRAGFVKLLRYISDQGKQPSQCAVLMEVTGHYHRALLEFLVSEGFLVYIIAVHHRRVNGQSKTDKADALRLANQLYAQLALGLQIADKSMMIRKFEPPSDESVQLQGLVHRRHELQEQHTCLKNKLTAILDELFPEFTTVFLDPNATTALDLRQRFPTPAIIASASIEELGVVKYQRGPSDAKLKRLQEAARQSIGVTRPSRLVSLTLEQGQLIEAIRLLRTQLEALEAKITAIVQMSREGQILLSLPVLGPIHAATFIACVGNIRNFPNVATFRKFCGWAPQDAQTGISLNQAKMNQTGSRLLRQALWLTTMTAISHKDTFWSKLYYRLVPLKCAYDPRLKRYRGRMRVVGRVAGQMAGLVYTLLKQDADLVDHAPDPQHLPEPTLYDAEIHWGRKERTDSQHNLDKGSQIA